MYVHVCHLNMWSTVTAAPQTTYICTCNSLELTTERLISPSLNVLQNAKVIKSNCQIHIITESKLTLICSIRYTLRIVILQKLTAL